MASLQHTRGSVGEFSAIAVVRMLWARRWTALPVAALVVLLLVTAANNGAARACVAAAAAGAPVLGDGLRSGASPTLQPAGVFPPAWVERAGQEEPPQHPATVFPGGRAVVAIMGIWDEALTLPMALDSTRDAVTEYIVVHKPGADDTKGVLDACVSRWGLRVRYWRSNMTLRDARLFGLAVAARYADVFVIQDGDEVFYQDGPTALRRGLELLRPGVVEAIMSKMIYLKHDLAHTLADGYKPGDQGKWGGHPANGIQLIPHLTVALNIPGRIVMPEALALDVPVYTGGPDLTTHEPWKFDVSIKSPLRELLRDSFLHWSAAGSPGRIEDWAATHDTRHLAWVAANQSSSLEESAVLHLRQLITWLAPYSEAEWFPYPRVLRKYLDAGMPRGFAGVFPPG